MNTRSPAFRLSLLVVAAVLSTGGTVPAAEPDRPHEYPLSEVTIVLLDGTTGGFDGWTRIEVRGTGAGIRRTRRRQQTGESNFRVSSEELVTLLDSLHRIYFDEMPRFYREPYEVRLLEDGTVQTWAVGISDGPFTTLELRIGEWAKSVTWDRSAPGGLLSVARGIRNLAE